MRTAITIQLFVLCSGIAGQPGFPGLTLQSNFTAHVFADTNHSGNAVAICFDGPGNLYTVEANRRLAGTWGVTMSRWWAMEDYAGKTLQNRADMYARWVHIVPPAKLTMNADVLRRITDQDGDGRADGSKIVNRFNGPLEGNAAGVLAAGDRIYVANAPRILTVDTNGVRKNLLSGLGVRVGVYGHDLHGLVWGPDGRIYFSLGDRGFDVITQEGGRLSAPTRGAVFRCFPDGSGLELFHVGLRNPQDLAFNERGDLFTVDNDMGGVDRSRVVHVVEGGDSGWDASYQLTRNFREETQRHGHTEPPWFTENLWQTNQADQPKWLHPPVGYLTHGPSGMEFDIGWGLPQEYRNSFFVCDFRGNSPRSGVYSFHLETKGAGYELVRTNTFAWGILPADIEFGWDGRMYLADWIGGWGGTAARRIVRLDTTEGWSAGDAEAVMKIMRDGFAHRDGEELYRLLGHVDRRVRLFAQYEIAGRDARAASELFLKALGQEGQRDRQLHGLWGLWQVGLTNQIGRKLAARSATYLSKGDSMMRAQVARVFGDLRIDSGVKSLLRLLDDDDPRARYFSAEALGKIGAKEAVPGLVKQLRRHGANDHTLRHATTLALSRAADSRQLIKLAAGEPNIVRLGILLALRHQRSPEIQAFLADADPRVVGEAVRAIHDRPIAECLSDLAGSELHAVPGMPFPVAHRVLNANFRIGGRQNAERLAAIAGDSGLPIPLRLEALKCLERWTNPSPFDRVTWHHRPLTKKRELAIGPAIRATVLKYIGNRRGKAEAELRQIAGRLAVKYELLPADSLTKLARDPSLDATTRIAFFEQARRQSPVTPVALCRTLMADKSVAVRLAAAAPLLGESDAAAEAVVRQLWKSKDAKVRQQVVHTLAAIETTFAVNLLQDQLGQLGPTGLDVLEAGLRSSNGELRRRTAAWLEQLRTGTNQLGEFVLALSGGDKGIGQRIFATHAIQCVRCHQVKGFGGDAGPELTKIGRTLKPEQLVESLIDPSARIAEGFGTFEFALKDGESLAGFVRSEDDRVVKLAQLDGRVVEVRKDQISRRSSPQSSMPAMREALSRGEIRDLVAYLSALR